MEEQAHFIGLFKNGELYFFLYNRENYNELLKTLGRFASNPDLSFTWENAAMLGKKAKEMQKEDFIITIRR